MLTFVSDLNLVETQKRSCVLNLTWRTWVVRLGRKIQRHQDGIILSQSHYIE